MVYYLYKITNLLNGKQYVGITNSTRRRWSDHKSTSKKYPLACALRKYGSNNFEFKTLVIGDEAYIKELEIKAIAAFNTKAPNGYNLTDGGEGMSGYKQHPEHTEKIRQANLGKKQPKHAIECCQKFMLDNKINHKPVKVYGIHYSSIKEAASLLHLPYATLQGRFARGTHPEQYQYI